MTAHRSRVARLFLLLLCFAAVASAQDLAPSAWDALLAADPERAVSLPSLDRKVLQVLTPDQGDSYRRGADPATLAVTGGETLDRFMERVRGEETAGLVFRPLAPCTVVDTRQTGARLAAGEVRGVRLVGEATDLSAQGGSPKGCGVAGLRNDPTEARAARAVLLQVEVPETGGSGGVKLWPSSRGNAPELALVSFAEKDHNVTSSVLVELCDDVGATPCRDGDLHLMAEGADVDLVLTVLGFFELPQPVEKGAGDIVLPNNDGIVFEAFGGTQDGTEIRRFGGNALRFRYAGNVAIFDALQNHAFQVRNSAGSTIFNVSPAGDAFFANTGNVGIGTTLPADALHVDDPVFPTLRLTGSGLSGTLSIATVAGYYSPVATPGDVVLRSLGGDVVLAAPTGALRVVAGASETAAVTVLSNGNLGVGTETPTEKLHVAGDIKLSGSIVSDGDICIGSGC